MIVVEKLKDYSIVRFTEPNSEIEFNNVGDLKTVLNDLIGKNEKKILIDFKNVVYIDSSGLGVLIDAVKRLNKASGEMGILSISKDVLDVFTATKIGQYFRFYKDLS
ncbi:MAG: STAS domain-containing protein [bacterium]|nr:STAS domain-containing protein [bacterium]